MEASIAAQYDVPPTAVEIIVPEAASNPAGRRRRLQTTSDQQQLVYTVTAAEDISEVSSGYGRAATLYYIATCSTILWCVLTISLIAGGR